MAKAAASGSLSLTDLPTEIIHNIASLLEFSSLLRLRICSPNRVAKVVTLSILMAIKAKREDLMLLVEELVEQAVMRAYKEDARFLGWSAVCAPSCDDRYSIMRDIPVKMISKSVMPDWTDSCNTDFPLLVPCYRCFTWKSSRHFSDDLEIKPLKTHKYDPDLSIITKHCRSRDKAVSAIVQVKRSGCDNTILALESEHTFPPSRRHFHSWTNFTTNNTIEIDSRGRKRSQPMPPPKCRWCIPCIYKYDPWMFEPGRYVGKTGWYVCICGELSSHKRYEPPWSLITSSFRDPRKSLSNLWCKACWSRPQQPIRNYLLLLHQRKYQSYIWNQRRKWQCAQIKQSSLTEKQKQQIRERDLAWAGGDETKIPRGKGHWCPLTKEDNSYCNCHMWYEEAMLATWEKLDKTPSRPWGGEWPPFKVRKPR